LQLFENTAYIHGAYARQNRIGKRSGVLKHTEQKVFRAHKSAAVTLAQPLRYHKSLLYARRKVYVGLRNVVGLLENLFERFGTQSAFEQKLTRKTALGGNKTVKHVLGPYYGIAVTHSRVVRRIHRLFHIFGNGKSHN
jgi:hypothetical protein